MYHTKKKIKRWTRNFLSQNPQRLFGNEFVTSNFFAYILYYLLYFINLYLLISFF